MQFLKERGGKKKHGPKIFHILNRLRAYFFPLAGRHGFQQIIVLTLVADVL